MSKKIKKICCKNSETGQNMIEYIIVLVSVVIVVIAVVGPSGFLTNRINDSINEAVLGTKCLALNECYDPSGCSAVCGNDCCEGPTETAGSCPADCG